MGTGIGYWVLGGLLIVGALPKAIKDSVYNMVSDACLSRVVTLGLVMASAVAVAMNRYDMALGISLFALNLVRRNGGRGSIGYVSVVLIIVAAVNGVGLSLGVEASDWFRGAVGAMGALMLLQLVLALTNTFSSDERAARGKQAMSLLVAVGVASSLYRNADALSDGAIFIVIIVATAYMVTIGCKKDHDKQVKRPTLDYVSGDYLSNVINR